MVIRSYEPSYRGGAETEQPNLFTPNNDGNFFIPGLIDGRQRNNFHFAFGERLTLMDIGGYPSQWRTDFFLGHPAEADRRVWSWPARPNNRWWCAEVIGRAQ